MALTAAAEAELRAMLRSFRAAHAGVVAPTGDGKALEAWVLMKLAHTVHRSMSTTWRVTLPSSWGTGPATPSSRSAG